MNPIDIKRWVIVLLLLAISPFAIATQEPEEKPREEQSTIEILMKLLTPGGTSHGPP
jgi:hypothetical protein